MSRKRNTGASRRSKLIQSKNYVGREPKGHKTGRRRSLLRDCCILALVPTLVLASISPKASTSKWLAKLRIAFSVLTSDTPEISKIASALEEFSKPEAPPAKTEMNPIRSEPPPQQAEEDVISLPNQKNEIPSDKIIAYVVPFIQGCGRRDTMRDASAVLRHSIHLQSAQNPSSKSQYGYQMYALTLKNKNCPIQVLEGMGYKVFEVDSPVNLEDIENAALKNDMGKGNTDGGVDSYIQLLANELVDEPIFVILNINALVLKPLDHLFLAIQNPGGTPEGDNAREIIRAALERPGDGLPQEIDHFFVRDYPNTAISRKPVVLTPGFLVARKNPNLVGEAINLIHQANYYDGNGETSGWGGKGYTMYWMGGATMPGFYAYFLDEFLSDTSVELDGCKYNHNGMDNLFRNPPRFHPSSTSYIGKCRSGAESCGDCTTTNVESIYTILYDRTCFHPWKCYGEGVAGGTQKMKINTQLTPVEHCLALQKEWHSMRQKIELSIAKGTNSADIERGQKGPYKSEFFHGHCMEHGNYIEMTMSMPTQIRIPELLWGGK